MKVNFKYLLFILISILVSITPFILLEEYNLIAAAGLIIPVGALLIFKERLWLQVAILTFPVYFLSSGTGFSATEAAMSVIVILGLILWITSRLFDPNYQLIRDKTDFLFIFFFFMMILLSILSIVNGNESAKVISETFRAITILYYFPIRDNYRTKEKLKQLLILLAVSLTFLFLASLYQNYLRLLDFKSIWELGHFKRNNAGIAATSLIFYIMFFLNKHTKLKKLIILGLVFLSALSLIITVARIYWIATIFGVFVATIFLDQKRRTNLYLITISILLIIFGSIFILFPDLANAIIKVFADRFTSIFEFKTDSSFKARLIEYNVALSYIERFPLGGAGIARDYSYYNFLDLANWVSAFIHNGYLHQSYQMGIPMMLLYMGLIVTNFIKSINLAITCKDNFMKTIAIGSLSIFLLFLIVNFVTSTFSFRDEPIMLGFAIAFIKIIYNIENNDYKR